MAAPTPTDSKEVKAPVTGGVVNTKGQFDYDVIIAGAGAAGLQAALVLGRARRRVLVIDEGAQCNISADKVGGLLGQKNISPAQLYAYSHDQLKEFPTVTVRHQTTITSGVSSSDHITITATSKDSSAPLSVTGRRLMLTMGLHWQYNESIPNAQKLWGRTLFHCPFCHAWELRDQPMAVINNGPAASHLGMLLTMWTKDIVICTNGPSTIDEAAAAKLTKLGVAINERPIATLETDGDEHDPKLKAIQFTDGSSLARTGALMGALPKQRASASWMSSFGLIMTELGCISVDKIGRTSQPMIWAAGDIAGPVVSVAAAMGTGSTAGLMLANELFMNDNDIPFVLPPFWSTPPLPASLVHSGATSLPPSDAAAPVAKPPAH